MACQSGLRVPACMRSSSGPSRLRSPSSAGDSCELRAVPSSARIASICFFSSAWLACSTYPRPCVGTNRRMWTHSAHRGS